jgi:hypothetical protein
VGVKMKPEERRELERILDESYQFRGYFKDQYKLLQDMSNTLSVDEITMDIKSISSDMDAICNRFEQIIKKSEYVLNGNE